MSRLVMNTLMEFFYESLQQALAEQKIQVGRATEYYLVDLLSRYSKAESLLQPTHEQQEKTYGELYLESYHLSPSERSKILKYIGDTTLFLCGFFSESFKRKLVDIDYYAMLGRASYSHLVEVSEYIKMRIGVPEVFAELVNKLLDLIDVIAEIGEKTQLSGSTDLLRVYERWLRTHSKRDRKLLREKGIEPIRDITPKFIH
ncbi:MAG TPA: hypothetical protein ENI41_07590 [Deltaproteobacteria bacterium]|nr:hypothetical protein [Deltaproteobacteria bacterium]